MKADSPRPWQPITLSGMITDQSQLDSGFNGEVQVTLFGPASDEKTLGDEAPETVMTFQNRQQKLFNGKATVKAGKFTSRFILPSHISEAWKTGKFSFYATNEAHAEDATGSYEDILLGGKPLKSPTDQIPPTLLVYLNHTNFK